MPEADRRLREVAQLRKLWLAFRGSQGRLEDQRISRDVLRDRSFLPRVSESLALYGRAAVRAAIRHWWCTGDYAGIIELAERLDPGLLDDEPLIHVYLEEAKARLAETREQ